MAHEVETMMYVGEEPWHGLGRSIPQGKRLSIDKAIKAAGLDWEVGLRHIYTEDDKNVRIGIVDRFATYRKSDNSVLGIVGADYMPLQNRDAFKWFQPFLDNKEASIETAGSLRWGRIIWVLARINLDTLRVKGDDAVRSYVLLSNSHDGTTAVRAGFTPIRVVCNNTLSIAHESETSKLLRVRHTRNLACNLETIREIMNLANTEFEATVEQYRMLAGKGILSKDLTRYVRTVFNLDENSGKKLLPKITALFEDGRGSDMDAKTYWGAYNAVTEYLNYHRGKSQDSTLNSLWFGESSEINKRALRVGLEMVDA